MYSDEWHGQALGPRGDGKRHDDSVASRTRSRQSVSSVATRREDQQRRENQYCKWQDFKKVQQEEKHTVLKEKISLQHELIKAQDELFHRRRLQTECKLEELRKSDQLEKKQNEEVLVQKCKKELERDKEEQLTRRAQERAADREKQKEAKKKYEEEKHAGATSSAGLPRALSTIPSRDETGLSGLSAFEYHDATGVLTEEGEDVIQEEVRFEDLPIHKQKLYSLLGQKEAEYFLYPKVEPERKKVIRVPHSVKQQGGRAGANALWGTLRSRSKVKLQYADSRIPLELRDAYGAFVRECLTKNKTVAKRSFYSETEVPDNEKLQDSSFRERVKETQHRVELMYRAALTNEDKTSVLLYNNPMPDYNNLEGHEGPLRYLPSWVHVDDGDEAVRVPSYKRWLANMSTSEPDSMDFEDNFEDSFNCVDIDMADNEERDPADDDYAGDRPVSSQSLPIMAQEEDYPCPGKHLPEESMGEPTTMKVGKKKLIFLTEKAAVCEGQFMKNINSKDTSHDLVTGSAVMKARKAETSPSAPASSVNEGRKSTRRGKPELRSHTAPAAFSKSQPTTTSEAAAAGQDNTSRRGVRNMGSDAGWQPLTMMALNDYKPAIWLFGEGEFHHGQQFLWKPVLSTSTKGV